MPTTVLQDSAKLTATLAAFGHVVPVAAYGQINYAGIHWPNRGPRNLLHSLLYHDVEIAIAEARAMIISAYMAANGAIINGDDEGVDFMTRWFGPRNRVTDWWKGARAVLGAIQSHIVQEISVYYRGSDALIGELNDYPNPARIRLIARDVEGYAESFPNANDRRIGLCKLFFEKRLDGRSTMNLRGSDTVGGALVHELSHNLCGTEDHSTHDNSSPSCYGTPDCLDLASNRPSRAWYNADNIEYFAEDVRYKFSTAAPVAMAEDEIEDLLKKGAKPSVANLSKLFSKAPLPVAPPLKMK